MKRRKTKSIKKWWTSSKIYICEKVKLVKSLGQLLFFRLRRRKWRLGRKLLCLKRKTCVLGGKRYFLTDLLKENGNFIWGSNFDSRNGVLKQFWRSRSIQARIEVWKHIKIIL
jgi:hypothetical protein